MKALHDLAAELATAITGISPDATRVRGADESLFEVVERRKRIDNRTRLELLLVRFGTACIKLAKQSDQDQ